MAFGWAHITGAAITASLGPEQSLQLKTGETNISGSDNLMFYTGSNQLRLTGSLLVNGTIQADNYNIVNTTVSFLSASGDSKFGNTSGDRHQYTGSILLSGNLGVGTGAPSYRLHLFDDASAKPDFVIENANSNANGSIMHFLKSTSNVDNGDDIGTLAFTAKNASNAAKNYATILGEVVTKTASSEDGSLKFSVIRGGSSANALALYGNSAGGAVFNEGGDNQLDFRIESNGEDEAFFLDSSENTLYVNKGETAFTTIIGNDNDEAMRISAAGVIFNEDGHATNDFRVESDSETHMLFVDSSENTVGLGTSSPRRKLDVEGDDDLPQVRLTYTDNTHYADFSVTNNGTLMVRPSSRTMKIDTGDSNGGNLEFTKAGGTKSGAISWDSGDQDVTLYSEADLMLGAGGSSAKVFIDNGGNVGIGVTDPDHKLEISGSVHLSAEQSSPSAPSAGDGGLLYVKPDGKLYWLSDDISEIALTDYPTVANGVDNRIATFSAANALNGESALTFDGTRMHVSGGLQHKRVHKTGNYTVQTSDYFIGVNTVGGAVTITLPAASATGDGQEWVIKDEGGFCTGSHTIVVTGSHDSNTIDSGVSATVNSEHGAINIYSDGVSKFFIF